MVTLSDESGGQIRCEARPFSGYRGGSIGDETLRAIDDPMWLGATLAGLPPARIARRVGDDTKRRPAHHAVGTHTARAMAAPVAVSVTTDTVSHDRSHRTFQHNDARTWFMKRDARSDRTAAKDAAFRNGSTRSACLFVLARAPDVDAAFLAGTRYRAAFALTLGYGDPSSLFERLPLLDLKDVNRTV